MLTGKKRMHADPGVGVTPETHTKGIHTLSAWNCLYTNARSLRGKLPELQLLCEQHNPTLIGVTETWLSSEIHDSEVQLPNMTAYRCDRSDRLGGGSMLYVSSLLPSRSPTITEHSPISDSYFAK